MAAARKADLRRTTRETDIQVSLCLDGGEVEISTGIGFLTICWRPWPSTAAWG